jgi:hypothetical protein
MGQAPVDSKVTRRVSEEAAAIHTVFTSPSLTRFEVAQFSRRAAKA